MAATRREISTSFAAALAAAALPGAAAAAVKVKVKPDDRWIGRARAPVTIIEYFSTTCPHCADWQINVWPAFKAKYVDTGKVRFVARELPTAPVDIAAVGFLVARCAPKQRYFNVVEALAAGQADMVRTRDVVGWATTAGAAGGLTADQVRACVLDKDKIAAFNARVAAGAAEYDVNSTPTFIIGGEKLVGGQSLEALDAALEPLLRGKR
jgi:protein-disulfide isomerase